MSRESSISSLTNSLSLSPNKTNFQTLRRDNGIFYIVMDTINYLYHRETTKKEEISFSTIREFIEKEFDEKVMELELFALLCEGCVKSYIKRVKGYRTTSYYVPIDNVISTSSTSSSSLSTSSASSSSSPQSSPSSSVVASEHKPKNKRAGNLRRGTKPGRKRSKLDVVNNEDKKIFQTEDNKKGMKLEKVLPLAFVYQSEPKAASLHDIRWYLGKYYNMKNPRVVNKQMDILVKSKDITKVGLKYELNMGSIESDNDGEFRNQAANAILACNLRRIATKVSLRQYIKDFHEDIYDLKAFGAVLKKLTDENKIKLADKGCIEYMIRYKPSPEELKG